MSGIEGYSFVGKREDFNNASVKPQKYFATIGRLGTNKAALDTMAYGAFIVTNAAIIEATSTDSILKITNHDAKVGDIVRVKTSANGIKELDIVVIETTANTITLDGVASASFAAGDTVDILRPIPQRFEADGSVISAFTVHKVEGGIDSIVTILDDKDDPTNTVPLPVRIVGLSGDINFTAGSVDITLSHTGADPSSVRIGDGTELLAINASNEATVHDASVLAEMVTLNAAVSTETTLAAMSAKLGTLGQKNMAGSTPVVIASDQAGFPITNISGTVSLPTGASTAALQTSGNASLTTLAAVDYATQTTLAALNGKFSSLGQKATVNSAPVVLSTEQEAILSAIKTAVELIDSTVNGNSQLDVKLADLNGAATEVTLAAANAKLPSALGQQNSAGSLSVVIANDHQTIVKNLNVLTFHQVKFAVTNVTDSAYLEVIADIGATAGKKLHIFYAGGEPLYLATGAAASETNRMIVWPGMDREIDLELVANARISLKAVNASTTVSSGSFIVNLLG